jgi:glyoxylase-like metal-dependent hydrolase (beta-lactamase superfamily II)
MGFLLQNGKQNILVDTGINDRYIVDGKAFHNFPAVGGGRYVLEALEREGLTPKDIDSVIYTHLHNDHAGNAMMFEHARTYVQKDELDNLYFPLPVQAVGEFDPNTPEEMKKLDLYIVDGDIRLSNGLELYRAPGHTSGSQLVRIPTSEGCYVITGDVVPIWICMCPSVDKFELLDGSIIDISPLPGKYHFSFMHRNLYETTYSMDKIKILAENFEQKWILPAHDPWVINRHRFG